MSPRRIAILGGGGAGKSTLARELGEALGLPVTHLDRLVFGPGWKRVTPKELRGRVAAVAAGDGWIVEGTFAEASAVTLPRADLVLWLDQPAWLRLARAWGKVRAHRDKPRADRPDGCQEGFGPDYAWMILTFGGWSPRFVRGLEALAGRKVRRLRGDAGIRAFLDEIAAGG